MRRHGCPRAALALQLAAAFEVETVQVLASQLLPVGYTMKDGQTLSELSGCRFVDATTALFVEDKGAFVEADVTLDPFAVTPVRRTALQPTADSEGIALESDGTVLVSTEWSAGKGSALGVFEVDPITGSVLGAPFAPPQDTVSRVRDNKGFEALTLAPGAALGLTDDTYVVTTTEYALSDDAVGSHHVYAWRVADGSLERPPLPAITVSYAASFRDDGEPLGVVELEALDTSLLVLERTFQVTNTIRLFEASTAGDVFEKRLLLEWDINGMRDGDGGTLSALPVDNYEGMCLCPADHGGTRRLVLVNDDNGNAAQIGTQFVLLALTLARADVIDDGNRGHASFRLFLIVVAVGASIVVCCAAFRYEVLRRRTVHISGDPGVMLSNLRFDADLVIPPRLTVPARSMARSARSMTQSGKKKKGYEELGRQEAGDREAAVV